MTGIRGRARRMRDEEWMMALERHFHADADLPCFCIDKVVLGLVETEEEEEAGVMLFLS